MCVGAVERVSARRRVLMAAACAVLALQGGTAFAHGAGSGDLPPVRETVVLKHANPSRLMQLFSRPRPADPVGRPQRAAQNGTNDSLLPAGIQAVLSYQQKPELLVVGSAEALATTRRLIRVLDAPAVPAAGGRERMVLDLDRANPARIEFALRAAPGKGAFNSAGSRITLEGDPAWMHHALREVIRAELPKMSQAPASVADPQRI